MQAHLQHPRPSRAAAAQLTTHPPAVLSAGRNAAPPLPPLLSRARRAHVPPCTAPAGLQEGQARRKGLLLLMRRQADRQALRLRSGPRLLQGQPCLPRRPPPLKRPSIPLGISPTAYSRARPHTCRLVYLPPRAVAAPLELLQHGSLLRRLPPRSIQLLHHLYRGVKGEGHVHKRECTAVRECTAASWQAGRWKGRERHLCGRQTLVHAPVMRRCCSLCMMVLLHTTRIDSPLPGCRAAWAAANPRPSAAAGRQGCGRARRGCSCERQTRGCGCGPAACGCGSAPRQMRSERRCCEQVGSLPPGLAGCSPPSAAPAACRPAARAAGFAAHPEGGGAGAPSQAACGAACVRLRRRTAAPGGAPPERTPARTGAWTGGVVSGRKQSAAGSMACRSAGHPPPPRTRMVQDPSLLPPSFCRGASTSTCAREGSQPAQVVEPSGVDDLHGLAVWGCRSYTTRTFRFQFVAWRNRAQPKELFCAERHLGGVARKQGSCSRSK